jgi:hypothetical protein
LNEGKEVFNNFDIAVHLDAKSLGSLSAVKTFFVKHLEDAARYIDIFWGEAGPLETDFVRGTHHGRVAFSYHKRGHILNDFGRCADHGIIADATKLMETYTPTYVDAVTNFDVTAEGGMTTHN